MKKLVFAFVMMLGLGLTSCGGRSEANVEATDCSCDSVCTCDSACNCNAETVDTLVVDSVEVDSIQ